MLPERIERLIEPGSVTDELSQLFTEAGHEIYLVGGSLRDFFLDRNNEDLDFATDARPDAIRKVIGGWADDVFAAGELFGTIGVVKRGTLVEITTFRSEVYRSDSRKPDVQFSDDIESDLSRRDFTINAMALRFPDLVMIDPWGGLDDVRDQTLRTPLSPEEAFGDDPLRMLRLYRFRATLGFFATDETEKAVRSMRDRIEIVSAERIRNELSKLLTAPAPGVGLWGLVESGLADHFIPELPALALEQDPHHQHKDVLAHTIAVVEKAPPELTMRLAALLHDVGKPATRQFGPGGVSFHHHEVVGARMARDRLRALRYPKNVVNDVVSLVSLHMRPHTFKMGWTDRAVRRYVRDAGPLLEQLNTLVRCDVTTRNRRLEKTIQKRIDELEERIAELREKEEIDSLRPPIDGHQVMAHLNLAPGPEIGEAMTMLTEHRIDHGPYDEEAAYALLDEWWEAHP